MQSGTQRTIGFATPTSELYHAARKCPRCTESTPLPLFSQLGLTSPLRFISCPHPETVTLHVGRLKHKIICHKALLGSFSNYFDALCCGVFAEASQETLELAGSNENDLIVFISWIYTGQILEASSLVKLCVFGDKLHSVLSTKSCMPCSTRTVDSEETT